MSRAQIQRQELAVMRTWFGISVYEAALFSCLLLTVVTKGTIGSFETLGVGFAETQFQVQKSFAGFVVGICGFLGVLVLLFLGQLAKIMSDIQMIVFGFLVAAAAIMSVSVPVLPEDEPGKSSWRYVFAIFFLYSIGYPIGHTTVIGLFSKCKFIMHVRINIEWHKSRKLMQANCAMLFCNIVSSLCSHRGNNSGWKKTSRVLPGLVRCGGIFGAYGVANFIGIYCSSSWL